MWFERWFLSSNAKDIGVLYLIYALFSGLVGTAFSVLIRLELSGPGVQFIADNQLYNSIITAHAIIMIFFMVKKYFILNSNFTLFKQVNSDNNKSPFLSEFDNNDGYNTDNGNNTSHNDPQNDNNKHNYVKVLVDDPYNNRDIILEVTKKQKENYSPNYLNPNWVTGFSDAEACFGFRIRKNDQLKTGWQTTPYFFINLHAIDLSVLLDIKQFFKVGNISHNKNSALYQVNSIDDIVNVIIPHFDLFPLISKKKADFLLFKLAIELIRKKEHKSIKGINKLVGIKAHLNKGNLEILKTSFPNVVPVERPEVALPETIDPNWFAGFTSGDGSFSVEIQRSSSYKIGFQVIIKFSISQHTRDLELLKCFINFIGGGLVKERKDTSEFVVVKLSLLTEKLIPLFQKYPIHGVKYENFKDFCKIVELMNSNAHRTPEGLENIRLIKAGMNRGRKS